jgi:hypothetical protein
VFNKQLKGISAPKHYEESNDCSVRALANVTGKTYEDCHELTRRLGRADNMPMDARNLASACMRVDGKIKIVNNALSQLRNGKFIVIQRGHCFAYIDGVVVDTDAVDTGKEIICVFSF